MTGYQVRTTTPDGQPGVTVGFIDEADTMSFVSAIREGRFTVIEVVLSDRVVLEGTPPLGAGGCFCVRDADGAIVVPYGGCPVHGGVWARTPDDAMHVGGVVCTCGPVDVIGPSGEREDGPNGGGPDPDCPLHGEARQ